MKYIVVILDGSSGWPSDALEGNTSLEAAATPILDLMAKSARMGLAHTVPQGLEASSSVACTSILGFDPEANFVGRAAIEASAMGVDMDAGDVVLRINTVSLKDGSMDSYAGGHITTPESTDIIKRLAEALDDERTSLYPGVAYRHILKVSGLPGLLDLDYTPPHDISGKPVEGCLPRLAEEGSRAFSTTREEQEEALAYLEDLQARAAELLQDDPTSLARAARGDKAITDIWPFWPGVKPEGLPQFKETYLITGALSSGVDLLFGLAEIFGLTRLEIAGVSDGADNDYDAQVLGCLEALNTHDLVVIHIESPDEMGHAGDAEAKVAAIQDIDRKVMTRIFQYVRANPDTRVLAMPDHPTPLEIKTHVNEPVPFMIYGQGIISNGGFAFTERAAASTQLVLDPGYTVMKELLA